MASISASNLVSIINEYPDYEVIMSIKHKYPISKEEGKKGWIAYINGIEVDDKQRVIRLMN